MAGPHSVTDTRLAGIPCPTCGQFSPTLAIPPALDTPALDTPPALATPAIKLDVLEPSLDMPTFNNEHEELVYLREVVQLLCGQAHELQLLKSQVSDIARICNAVARGDLSKKITVPVQGDIMMQMKDVVNTMVDKLGHFTEEVSHVS